MKAASQEQEERPRQAAAGATALTFEQLEQAAATPLPLAPPRVQSYEELEGADGRSVFFRPHRYSAADLAPLAGTASVVVADVVRRCSVLDVSQNGVAVSWPGQIPIKKRQRLAVTLRFDDHEAFRGEATVGSVRPQNGMTVVGFNFGDFLLDVEELVQLRDLGRWGNGDQLLRARGSPWFTPGHHAFKSLVSDLRLYLEDTMARVEELEHLVPWHVVSDRASPTRAAMVSRLRSEVGTDVVRFAAEIDAALRQADAGDREALRRFSLRQVDRFLMMAPWMHRARHKPFGYPGDYEVMNFVYEKDFEGPTLFSRVVGHAFLQTPAALAVRYRKDLMKRQLRSILESRAGSARPVRFLSIAAGPAREIQELISEIDHLPAPLEVVLFEQDKGALAHAYRRLRPLVESRFPGRAQVVFLHDSIKRLLRDPHLFDQFGRFDAVYSCGLFDYLRRPTAVKLAENLHAVTAAGGRTFIANMVDHPGRWFMEDHLEWELIYRTREELQEIGRQAAPGARMRVLEEEAGVNPFIELARD